MFESSKFDKSGGHIRPGPDLAGFEKTAGFRPRPDMISGATIQCTSCKLFITPYINNSMLSKKKLYNCCIILFCTSIPKSEHHRPKIVT